jgi:hypothetical protein
MAEDLKTVVLAVLALFFFLALSPIIFNKIGSLSMAAWTFTGHELAQGFLTAFPFIWLAVGLGLPGYIIVKEMGG